MQEDKIVIPKKYFDEESAAKVLIAAVKEKDLETTKTLLEAGFDANGVITDVNVTEMGGESYESVKGLPISYAAAKENIDMVRILVNNGAGLPYNTKSYRVDKNENEYDDIMKIILRKENEDIFKEMAKDSKDFITMLKWSIDNNCLGRITDIIKDGFDLNRSYNKGDTPVMEAVEHIQRNGEGELNKEDIEIVEYLVKNGADVTIPNNFGHTPLSLAIWRYENDEFANYLIENGASLSGSIEALNDKKRLDPRCLIRCIEFAIDNNCLEEIDKVIKEGLDLNVPEINNHSALAIIARNKSFQNTEVIDYLVSHGANVNEIDAEGYTPLSYAILISKNDTVAKSLIDNGASFVNSIKALEGKGYFTSDNLLEIIECAIENGCENEIDKVVKEGLDLNKTCCDNDDGENVLTKAILEDKDSKVINYLMKAGAKIETSIKLLEEELTTYDFPYLKNAINKLKDFAKENGIELKESETSEEIEM